MSDLLKSIDNAQIEAGREKIVYRIDGWCVFQDRHDFLQTGEREKKGCW